MSTVDRKDQRPLPDLESDPRNTLVALLGLAVIIACSVWIWSVWDGVPDTVNTHFGVSGEPDGTGSKYSVIALPATALLMWAGLGFLTRIPHRYNYAVAITPENAQRQYALGVSLMSWMRLTVPLMMCYIAWAGLRTSMGDAEALDPMTMAVLGLGMMCVVAVHLVLMLKAK